MKRWTLTLVAMGLGILVVSSCSREGPVFRAHLEPSANAFELVNWYTPMKLALMVLPDSVHLPLPPDAPRHRRLGRLRLGTGPDSMVTVVVAEDNEAGVFRIYIDANRDGDLSNDGDGRWSDVRPTHFTTRTVIPVSYVTGDSVARVDYPLALYRFRDRLPDHLLYYREGYRSGRIALKDTTHRLAVLDENADGRFDDLAHVMVVIDVDADGQLDGMLDSAELFEATKPFNVGGTTYRVRRISPMGDEIVLALADTSVASKPYISPGHRAPEFTMESLDGREIRLSDYRGRVVLLDFWATWCQPCIVELPNVVRTYSEYNHRGFEIIGLSLDEDRDRLVGFVKEQKIPWPQLFDGKGWKMEIAQLYRVSAIPATYLLDRNGTIRYKNLRGRELARRVEELLAEPVAD